MREVQQIERIDVVLPTALGSVLRNVVTFDERTFDCVVRAAVTGPPWRATNGVWLNDHDITSWEVA